ncbi:hypothetical protein HID58_067523 [Brassica napus]|uniref:Uncharacterized protein n=2 Tax=Brassica TaxID=3705 RepID=A0ABQ7ZIQ8_BRANA|nr:hypothetical protein HID58_067523 [Brassica napus]
MDMREELLTFLLITYPSCRKQHDVIQEMEKDKPDGVRPYYIMDLGSTNKTSMLSAELPSFLI